jgi:hypothetical protein
MRAIKGNIGAERAEKWNSLEKLRSNKRITPETLSTRLNAEAGVFFVADEQKKMLGVPGLRRRISPFARTGSLNRFRLL